MILTHLLLQSDKWYDKLVVLKYLDYLLTKMRGLVKYVITYYHF